VLCKALQRSTCPWSPSKGEHIDVHAYLRRRSFCQCGSKAQPPFRGVEQDGVSLAMNMTTRSPFVYSPEGGRSNQVLPPRNTCQSNMLVGGAALYLPAPADTQGWKYFSLSSVGGFVHCGINSNQALPWQSSGKISTYTKKNSHGWTMARAQFGRIFRQQPARRKTRTRNAPCCREYKLFHLGAEVANQPLPSRRTLYFRQGQPIERRHERAHAEKKKTWLLLATLGQ